MDYFCIVVLQVGLKIISSLSTTHELHALNTYLSVLRLRHNIQYMD